MMDFHTSIPLWIAILIIFPLIAAIIYLYRRIDTPLRRSEKLLLVFLRGISISLVLFCLIEPAVTYQKRSFQKAELAILIDDSQSMSIPDMDGRKSRSSIVKELLLRNSSFIDELNKRFNVQLYRFSSQLSVLLDEADRSIINQLKSDGNATDIESAIKSVSDELKGRPTAGIILVSDGANNFGKDPINTSKHLEIPIFTVGVGSRETPKDVAILNVRADPIAYVGHQYPIDATFTSNGYHDGDVRISLIEGRTVVDTLTVPLDSKGHERTVQFNHKFNREGVFNMKVSASILPGESSVQNNSYEFVVKVMKTKINVLYIEGALRWEYAFSNRALRADPDVEVTSLIMDEHGYYPVSDRRSFPSEVELSRYDVIIIGDVKADLLKGHEVSSLVKYVEEKGGALLFLGGNRSLGREGVGRTALSKLLPMEIGEEGAGVDRGTHNITLTEQGYNHPVTKLSENDDENSAIWRSLPPLTKLYTSSFIKAGAVVLIRTQTGKPVILFHRYGRGIVMLCATDELWKWAFQGHPFGIDDSTYKKLLSRMVRFLTYAKDKADRMTVITDKRSYYKGERVRISAYVYDETYQPIKDAQVSSRIQAPNGSYADIVFLSQGDGKFVAEYIPTNHGQFKVTVKAFKDNRLLCESSTYLFVEDVIMELQNARLDEDLLKEIASVSGGKYYYIKEAVSLLDSIDEPDGSVTYSVQKSLWDNMFVISAIILSLTLEWIYRKRKGLA